MIGFTVIGGYLGAGKTTALNRLLAGCEGRRLGILVNDFGAINIDADLVESRSDARINLTNGCICCSLAGGFAEAVDELLSIEPPLDHIVVEASGVADVHQLAQYGRAPGLRLDGVLVVADAETLLQKVEDRYVGTTVRRQLASADLILLNKVDLIEPADVADRLHWLRTHAPAALVIPCTRCDVPVDLLLGVYPDHDRNLLNADHAQYVSWSVEYPWPVERRQLERFCGSLGSEVVRAKGTVGRSDGVGLVLQVVGRRVEIHPLESAPPGTRLVAIGLAGQLDPAALDRLAREHLCSVVTRV